MPRALCQPECICSTQSLFKTVRILPLYQAEDVQALCRQAPLPQRFAHLHMAYYPQVAQALQQACGAHFEVLRHERHNVSVGLWRQAP